jgi:hypothetical protein
VLLIIEVVVCLGMLFRRVSPGDVNGSVPEVLFHLLNKMLLLKNLWELKLEKTIYGKEFYKAYRKRLI